jgi:AraC-like DNA-binding protein
MREKYPESLTIDDLASAAHMSVFHFSRVFKVVTQLSPMQFLAAIRVAAAKQLLVQTERSVTAVCLDVGYESLGSFSTHFSEMVGVSPLAWRVQMRELSAHLSGRGGDVHLHASNWSGGGARQAGRIMNAPEDLLVCVGVFRKPIPFGRPEACSLCIGPSRFPLPSSSGGQLFLFALGCGASELTRRLLDDDLHGCQVTAMALPNEENGALEIPISLRTLTATDPPVLSAMPLFLAERSAQTAAPVSQGVRGG